MVRMERGVWGDVGCVGRVESRWGQVCVWGRESTHVPVESSESYTSIEKCHQSCSLTLDGGRWTHTDTLVVGILV